MHRRKSTWSTQPHTPALGTLGSTLFHGSTLRAPHAWLNGHLEGLIFQQWAPQFYSDSVPIHCDTINTPVTNIHVERHFHLWVMWQSEHGLERNF